MDLTNPTIFAAFFSDEEARIDSEVSRISAMMLEQQPMAQGPKYLENGALRLPMPKDSDAAFMEKVAEKFRGKGWETAIENGGDPFCGTKESFFVLRHPSLEKLPGRDTTSAFHFG